MPISEFHCDTTPWTDPAPVKFYLENHEERHEGGLDDSLHEAQETAGQRIGVLACEQRVEFGSRRPRCSPDTSRRNSPAPYRNRTARRRPVGARARPRTGPSCFTSRRGGAAVQLFGEESELREAQADAHVDAGDDEEKQRAEDSQALQQCDPDDGDDKNPRGFRGLIRDLGAAFKSKNDLVKRH